jgi:hypothetical protein
VGEGGVVARRAHPARALRGRSRWAGGGKGYGFSARRYCPSRDGSGQQTVPTALFSAWRLCSPHVSWPTLRVNDGSSGVGTEVVRECPSRSSRGRPGDQQYHLKRQHNLRMQLFGYLKSFLGGARTRPRSQSSGPLRPGSSSPNPRGRERQVPIFQACPYFAIFPTAC